MLRKALLAAASVAALLSGGAAFAQQATQQATQHLDASAVTASVSSAINATTSISLTPPAGQFLYLQELYMNICPNGTGTAQNQVSFTTTNLPSTPAFEYSIPATASTCLQLGPFHWPNGLKSSAAGTAVTVVTPPAAASNSYQIFASGYYSQ
jgi:hypothetical protein